MECVRPSMCMKYSRNLVGALTRMREVIWEIAKTRQQQEEKVEKQFNDNYWRVDISNDTLITITMTIIFSNHLDPDSDAIRTLWAEWNFPFKLIEIRPKDELWELRVTNALIEEDDCLILIGHGTTYGLLHPDFNSGEYIIHEENVNLIHAKRVYCCWCYASTFCQNHHLNAFATSMFISNVQEAYDNCIYGYTQEQIDANSKRFEADMSYLILNNIPMDQWTTFIGARTDIENPIDVFNRQGLWYN